MASSLFVCVRNVRVDGQILRDNEFMNQYLDVIRSSFLAFPFLAFLFTLPYLLYCYHRYGSVWSFRILVVYSGILYLLTICFLVILPLPSRAEVAAMHGPIMNLDPLQFIRDFGKELPEHGVIRNPALWQVLFNILMFVPLGLYLRYWLGLDLRKTILMAFCLSLCFELIQLSGLFGVYPRPYRLFDVDDLIANTAGGACGWALYSPLRSILPSRQQVDLASRKAASRVSLLRRLTGLIVDGCLILIILGLDSRHAAEWISLYFLAGAVSGATPGMRVVRLRIDSDQGLTGRILLAVTGLAGCLWLPILSLRIPLLILPGILLWLLLTGIVTVQFLTGRPTLYETWTDSKIVSSVNE